MSKKILLVAEDADVKVSAARAVAGLNEVGQEGESVELICAEDGRAALCLLNEKLPDLLIAEISLPGKTGYELCRSARDEPEFASLRVLLIDSRSDSFHENLAYGVGADAYLSKPLQPAELIEVVHKLLAGEAEFDVADRRQQAQPADGYAVAQPHALYDADALPALRQPPQGQTELPVTSEATRPRGGRHRHLLLGATLVGAILLMVAGLTTFLRTHTPIPAPTRSQAPVTGSASVGGFEAAALEPPKTASNREDNAVRADDGSSPPQMEAPAADNPPNAKRERDDVRAAQTLLPGKETAATANPAIHGARRMDNPGASAVDEQTSPENKPVAYHPPSAARRVKPDTSYTAGDHLRKGGQELKKAGKHIGGGAKHIGMSSVKATTWAGRKVGRAFKKIF